MGNLQVNLQVEEDQKITWQENSSQATRKQWETEDRYPANLPMCEALLFTTYSN